MMIIALLCGHLHFTIIINNSDCYTLLWEFQVLILVMLSMKVIICLEVCQYFFLCVSGELHLSVYGVLLLQVCLNLWGNTSSYFELGIVTFFNHLNLTSIVLKLYARKICRLISFETDGSKFSSKQTGRQTHEIYFNFFFLNLIQVLKEPPEN